MPPYREAMREFEAYLIEDVIAQADGNITQAARDLCLPLATLKYRMRVLGVRIARPVKVVDAVREETG